MLFPKLFFPFRQISFAIWYSCFCLPAVSSSNNPGRSCQKMLSFSSFHPFQFYIFFIQTHICFHCNFKTISVNSKFILLKIHNFLNHISKLFFSFFHHFFSNFCTDDSRIGTLVSESVSFDFSPFSMISPSIFPFFKSDFQSGTLSFWLLFLFRYQFSLE